MEPTSDAEAARLRKQDESFWQARAAVIKALEADTGSFLLSRTPDSEHPGPRCLHANCNRPRVSGVGAGETLPRYCRFHLTVFLAKEIAPAFKGDPEQFVSPSSSGLLRILIEERLLGGTTAREAHEALKEYCGTLLEWNPVH